MILKLLKNLFQTNNIFTSNGFLSKAQLQQNESLQQAANEEKLKGQYSMYYNSWVEKDCRNKGHQSLTFDEWKHKQCIA